MSLQGEEAHRALVWLLTRVPAHVDNQHVLGLEGLLLPGAGLPAAHKLLLLPMDVLIVDMLEGRKTRQGREVRTRRFLGSLSIQLGPSCMRSPFSHRLPPALRDPPSKPKASTLGHM